MADAPCAFVGHSALALDFLGRNPMPSAGHEIHRKEPDRQFGAGVVKDGSGAWIDVMAAFLARIGAPFGHLVVKGAAITDGAMVSPPAVLDLHYFGQAGRVIRVYGLKLLEGVFRH